MKRCLILVFCFLLFPASPIFCQQPNDPATREDVQKLIDLTGTRKQFDSLMDVFKQQVPLEVKDVMANELPDATPEESKRISEFMTQTMASLFSDMPYDELTNSMIPAYQHHLTRAEVHETVQFYSSATGQKLITEMPAILTEYMEAARPVMVKWMQVKMEDLKTKTAELVKTIQQERAAKHPQKPSQHS